MNNIKVVIVDDHHLIAEGIRSILRYHYEIEVVASYTSGAALLKGLEIIQPDILLLDIQMPELHGDEIAKIVKGSYPKLKIIVLTNFDNIFYIKNMLQHNVDGYILKSIPKDDLTAAITCVYHGGTYIDASIQRILDEDARIIKRQKETGSMLTKRELEILKLIAQNYTSMEIAEQLFISKRTVDHHRKSIFSKMDVKKVSELIKKAAELNFIATEL